MQIRGKHWGISPVRFHNYHYLFTSLCSFNSSTMACVSVIPALSTVGQDLCRRIMRETKAGGSVGGEEAFFELA